MNTLLESIFSSETSEFTALTATPPTIDFDDWPVTPAQVATLQASANAYYVTPPVSTHDEYEIEFDHSNTFWSCNDSFANAACGASIRQALAHLVDKITFTNLDPSVGTKSTPIDNAVPPSDGLLTPNPCGYDPLFPETNATTGNRCIVGTSASPNGGAAYNLAPGTPTGLCGTATAQAACAYPWMRGFGSPDFCAAADHLIAAGLAIGKDPTTCVLTGVNTSAVTSSPVNFFVRSDKPPRFRLGLGMSQTICALFTGSYTVGCTTTSGPTGSCIQTSTTSFPTGSILCVTEGSISAFPGFTTCKATGSGTTCTPLNNWWIYTAGFGLVFPFDSLIYSLYNSLFVSAPGPPCSSTITSSGAINYLYTCVALYDTWSSAMEVALCTSAVGDPTGSSNAIAGTCPGATGTCPTTPTACSAVSAGFQTEILGAQNVFSIPVYSPKNSFAYLAPPTGNSWIRTVNSVGAGTPNYFAWLNSWNANPVLPGTMRQGFASLTTSLNPYSAATVWDFQVIGNLYDSIYAQNPANNNQVIDWMTKSHSFVSNSGLGYTPPASTTISLRNDLRSDIFWHDGSKVTAFDVAFSYASLIANGRGPPVPITGITVVSPTRFDLNLQSTGPFTLTNIGGGTIIPGQLWYASSSGCPSSWSAVTSSALPFVTPTPPFVSVASVCLNTSGTLSSPRFDPLSTTGTANGKTVGFLDGSGPFVCETATLIGGGCSSTGLQNPPEGGTYTLTRLGCTVTSTGTTCATSPYFRSSTNLALWAWSGMTGSLSGDFLTASKVASCFLKAPGTSGCTHWQQGIGNPNGNGSTTGTIGLLVVTAVTRFFLVNWVAPNTWTDLTGIGSYPPILYEGSITLSPSSAVGCLSTFATGGGYDC